MTLEQLKASVNNQNALYELLKEVRDTKKVWTHRASSTTSFLANPLHYALAQGLGVFFGSNDKTIVGTAVHAGVDYGYTHPEARLGLCIRALIEAVDEEMEKLKPELVGKITAIELIKEAIRVFKPYYKTIMPSNRASFVASEERLEIDVPVGMYHNPENFGRVKLTGTFDRLYKNTEGEFILGDLKTSAKTISGSVDKSQKLQDFEAEIGTLQAEIKSLEKVVAKFANTDEKVEAITLELNEVGNKFEDAKANGKATKAIENKIEKLEADLSKWLQNQEDRLGAIVDIETIGTALDSLKAEAQPLVEEYEANKYNANLEACKTQHGFQVALYSIMYMIVHGIEIKRVRLENVVKSKNPHIQIFEWELDENTLEKAEDAIQMVVSTVEAFFDGVDPKVLFRPNPFGYIGSETNELLASFGGAA